MPRELSEYERELLVLHLIEAGMTKREAELEVERQRAIHNAKEE